MQDTVHDREENFHVSPDQDFNDSHPPVESSSSHDVEPNHTPIPLQDSSLHTHSLTLPHTTIVEHVPGWTVFRDLYMSNGTLFIVTSSPLNFPDIRFMTSTGLRAENTPENIALREPTPDNMQLISPEEAEKRWGKEAATRRVWTVEGNTFLFNDPSQFLGHYYHFCAELLFGAWAFWTGAMTDQSNPPPPIHRAIFPHSSGAGWRDHPGFNAYFFRAAFPSITVEVDEDWADRVHASSLEAKYEGRAWHFPLLLLSDRSAAFRGKFCGSENQRTASEAVDGLIARGRLSHGGLWWHNVRNALWRFAGVDESIMDSTSGEFEQQDTVVVTYISRQSGRRHLIEEDHDGLVIALEELVERKNAERSAYEGTERPRPWELNIIQAEKLSKDEQVRIAARTTVLLGVHGNGLSHLILMPRTPISTVIEMFFPGGFAHDYEWTTGALGMQHFAVWNDTYYTKGDTPRVAYPEGFQGEQIPVYGPTVAKIVEDRVGGLI
ncbi:hypothetical protein SERLA73DRAFT_53149 [Serpula lacrymans var. lacrymans S7.3]|uniref:Glycosyltransferase 61 catalytic domain-containing protein n=2 Tax=Serpula lacrymans var. lacrymans TaxID=341189 RepID=F8PU32_SERL3|nr:hypothetical protein SERLA73DRAFT_53149 [Serpula lacrymans var. lacrymans S7.3]